MKQRLPGPRWIRAVAALALVPLICAGSVHAQSTGDLAAALVREAYTLVRDEALRPPDLLSLLHQTMITAQQAFIQATRAEPPPLPVLTADEGGDLEATAGYVQRLANALPRPDVIIDAALRGMIRATSDRQGAAFAPVEFTRFLREELRGERPGIGVQVDRVRDQIAVVDVTPGGPAARAGVRAGDVLLEVGGQLVGSRPPDDVVDLLRGPAGTSVAVALRREGAIIRLSLQREPARELPVRWSMQDTRIGYLRLLEFTQGAASDVRRALLVLEQTGAAALLLDLRNNGGGLVEESAAVASIFLTGGVVAMEERRGLLNPLAVVPLERRFTGLVVVLVNEFSASASEIVAAALQDTGVPLVGERTFGKATVQTIYPLHGGWGLRLTTARYFTRRGRAIDGVGLRPDVLVAMAFNQVQGEQDVQLRDAAALLRARLADGGVRR